MNDISDRRFTPNQPRAVLLDLDDTIIVDDSVSEPSWRIVCNRFAPLIGSISADEFYSTIKACSDDFWENPENHISGRLDLHQARRGVVLMAFSRLGLDHSGVAVELADAFTSEKDRAITLFPGALETLHSFKNRGLSLALITNGSAAVQRSKIERFGLEYLFDSIYIEGEFGVGKPDERVFRAALNDLKVDAAEAWMVGDDLKRDIAGAQKLGILGIWVDWRGRGLSLTGSVKPDYIIRSLSQLNYS